MLKFYQPGERKVADLPPKEPQTQSAPAEGQKNYGNEEYDDDDDNNGDDDDNEDDDYIVFSPSQRT